MFSQDYDSHVEVVNVTRLVNILKAYVLLSRDWIWVWQWSSIWIEHGMRVSFWVQVSWNQEGIQCSKHTQYYQINFTHYMFEIALIHLCVNLLQAFETSEFTQGKFRVSILQIIQSCYITIRYLKNSSSINLCYKGTISRYISKWVTI